MGTKLKNQNVRTRALEQNLDAVLETTAKGTGIKSHDDQNADRPAGLFINARAWLIRTKTNLMHETGPYVFGSDVQSDSEPADTDEQALDEATEWGRQDIARQHANSFF